MEAVNTPKLAGRINNLRIWNGCLAGVHAVMTGGLWWWFNSVNTRWGAYNKVQGADLSLYFNTGTVADIDNTYTDPTVYLQYTNSRQALQWWIVAVFLITAIFHLLYATDFFGSKLYSNALRQDFNHWRWFEYAITTTIMFYVMSVVTGVKDMSTIIILMFATFVLLWMGEEVHALSDKIKFDVEGKEVQETRSEKRFEDLSTHERVDFSGWKMCTMVYPCVAQAALLIGIFWVIIVEYNHRVTEFRTAGLTIPSWIGWLLYPMMIWYIILLVMEWLQIGFKWSEMQTEKGYLIWSLLSKLWFGFTLAYGFNLGS